MTITLDILFYIGRVICWLLVMSLLQYRPLESNDLLLNYRGKKQRPVVVRVDKILVWFEK